MNEYIKGLALQIEMLADLLEKHASFSPEEEAKMRVLHTDLRLMRVMGERNVTCWNTPAVAPVPELRVYLAKNPSASQLMCALDEVNRFFSPHLGNGTWTLKDGKWDWSCR